MVNYKMCDHKERFDKIHEHLRKVERKLEQTELREKQLIITLKMMMDIVGSRKSRTKRASTEQLKKTVQLLHEKNIGEETFIPRNPEYDIISEIIKNSK